MHIKLSIEQIRIACQDVSRTTRRPTVRRVMAELLLRHGACGSTQRVARILRAVVEQEDSRRGLEQPSEVASLREQLSQERQRAARAEELEKRHQDYWAARYQEKLAELEVKDAARNKAGVSSEQYLRLYQRAAELAQRLAKYEEVEPLVGVRGAD